MDLSVGANRVRITVAAPNGTTTETYTLNINKGVDSTYGWNALDDLDILIIADNRDPAGIWSDGLTMWVADGDEDEIYAYRMSGKQRVSGSDFDTQDAVGNNDPAGLHSDGATMWVADGEDKKIYAYRMSDRQRVVGSEFDTLDDAGNDDPIGIWSDGAMMWVADGEDKKIYAYRMSDRQRVSSRDFNTLDAAGNDNSTDIWSDGIAMWVADKTDDKVYSYNLETLDNADLRTLAVDGTEVTGFDPSTTTYDVTVADEVQEVTVLAVARDFRRRKRS